jgi:spermidine synthase
MLVATLGILPLALATRSPHRRPARALACLAGCVAALAAWLALPSDHVNRRALGSQAARGRLVTVAEGLTELIAVSEVAGSGRTLLTNGHAMSSTSSVSQRYMRALAHVPLLSMERPRAVLVIGFGVGNTTHAASLHPSIERVEVADLSRGILQRAGDFRDANHDVLADPRVSVYVNDGRHHLQMQQGPAYDLITLEPPPIAYAGVASLYSREFYTLARSRLVPDGYVSQWLPAYQVPTETTLSMIRAFLDVFPQSVLLSGAEDDLVLLGTTAARIEIEPAAVATALLAAPAVEADLARVSLGSAREIVGTFLGSSRTLADATLGRESATDDRPLQEYGVLSALNLGEAVPASVVDLTQLDAWCPSCSAGGAPAPSVAGLDVYMALLDLAYRATPGELAHLRSLPQPRLVAGSAYLGTVVPESAGLHNVLGLAQASSGNFGAAIGEFRAALALDPQSAATHWHLGAALAAVGNRDEAAALIRRSVELDPTNADARRDLAALTDGRER